MSKNKLMLIATITGTLYIICGLFSMHTKFKIDSNIANAITVFSLGFAFLTFGLSLNNEEIEKKKNIQQNEAVNNNLTKIINAVIPNKQGGNISMNINEYIDTRIDNQIDYYDMKAIQYKKMHDHLSIVTIILSASIAIIPAFVTLIPNYKNIFTFLSAFFAAIITILQTIDKLKKYNDLFYQYRMTCEKLKQEKILYLNNAGEYKSDSSVTYEQLFVERCESIMATENGTWAQLNEKKKD